MIDRTNDRSHVAWDIETTGFSWDDQITIVGFWFPQNYATLLLNKDGHAAEVADFESRLEDLDDGLSVNIRPCQSEAALLDQIHDVVFHRIESNQNRLVAFNADSWKGGFDLPFLRTSCLYHHHRWVFDGLQFANLWEPIKKRLNTTATVQDASTDVNSLGSHAILFGNTHPMNALDDIPDDHPHYRRAPYDPFDDSGSAVYCYTHNDFYPVLKHNLADIHRTWELGELVRQYVSPKDITTKKL